MQSIVSGNIIEFKFIKIDKRLETTETSEKIQILDQEFLKLELVKNKDIPQERVHLLKKMGHIKGMFIYKEENSFERKLCATRIDKIQ